MNFWLKFMKSTCDHWCTLRWRYLSWTGQSDLTPPVGEVDSQQDVAWWRRTRRRDGYRGTIGYPPTNPTSGWQASRASSGSKTSYFQCDQMVYYLSINPVRIQILVGFRLLITFFWNASWWFFESATVWKSHTEMKLFWVPNLESYLRSNGTRSSMD